LIPKFYIKEACVGNFDEAMAAQRSGAGQIELCSHLELDGCTPYVEDVRACIEQLSIPTKVMIRPKAGPFQVTDETFMKMKQEISFMKELGVSLIVYGMTTPDDRLDISRIEQLRDHSYPMLITIHKAIDTSVAILEDLDALTQLGGIHSVLTSGGATTAQEGMDTLLQMKRLAGSRIEIVPAGKITEANVDHIHEQLGLKTYHGRRIVPFI